MSATMQFGPEWMRTKPQNSPRSGATQAPPSPPPPLSNSSSLSGAATTRGADEANPFRYSKEDLLRIYKEGSGGKGHPIAPDVEKWPEVVRETEAEPISLREITNEERKLFADSLNSTIRRRQSTDVMSSPLGAASGERPRFSQTNSATGNRFGGLVGRRRDGAEPLTLPRRLSQSGQAPLGSPREAALPSPRLRGPTTPTFDGILSGVDPRLAKRKLSSAARGDLSATDHLNDRKNPDIKEDVELSSDNPPAEQSGTQNQGANGTSDTSHDPTHHHHQSGDPAQAPAQGPDLIAQGLSNMSISNQANGHPPNPDLSTSATPPIITDLAAVEWSYLDPQGQVQGPFRADIMQKWFDDGYFAPELLMRRTHLDVEWTPVGELCRLAGYEKVFLSPPRPPVGPPGITRRPDLPAQDPTAATTTAKGFASSSSPYQPIPTRLRTTALDNFPSTGSNPSDSPASSFGAGRFGNGSPDPAAFGGRAGISAVAAAAVVHEQGSPFGNRRGPFPGADQSRIARTPSYGNIAPGRANTFGEGGYRADETYLPDASPWPTSAGQYSNFNSPVISHQAAFGTRSIHESPMLQHAAAHVYPQNDFAALNAGLSRVSLDRGGSMGVDGFGLGINGGGPSSGQAAFVGSPALAYAQHQQQVGPGGPMANIAHSPLVTQAQSATPYHQPTLSATQSPWDTPAPIQGLRRPGPFDQHMHPTASNVFVNAPLAPEPESSNGWGSTVGGGPASLGQSETQSQKEQSSWFKSSEGVIDDRWKPVSGRHELTVSNLGEHNQQFQQQQQEQPSVQQQESVNAPDVAAATSSPQESAKPEPVVAEPAAPTPTPAPAPSSTGGKKKKNSTQQPIAETPAAAAITTAAVPSSAPTTKETTSPSAPAPAQAQAPTPAAAPAAKSPWGTDDENKKNKTAAPTPGLREIQEAETKKKAERERLTRAATATASSPTAASNNNTGSDEATGSFTWGLPTSQTGSRAANGVKESSGPTSAAAAVTGSGASAGGASGPATSGSTAVWGAFGGAAAGAKKTMKEIQEEEERQKKLAAKESMAAAAARRAYAETTSTAKPAAPAAPGNAWHTVGANGKTAPMTPPAAARPPTAAAVAAAASPVPASPAGAAAPVASTAARVVANNTGSLRPTTAAAVAAATRPVGNSRAEDFPVAPSQEFIKWLTESLKGLSNGVKLEEIASMLLSFPLDPDASTTEIISEIIYANSTMLDGRRFAAEFISKRKQDAASRVKNGGSVSSVNGSAAPAKAISIADIVKTQPKSKEPEWGGFKVHVNKKKKGGRA